MRRNMLFVSAVCVIVAMTIIIGCGSNDNGYSNGDTNGIYISDCLNHRIIRINDMSSSGWVEYGYYGSGVGQFIEPAGIDIGPDGKIYVTDTWNNRIVRMDDMTGTGWITYGTEGSESGEFNWLGGIDVGEDNKI